MSPHSARVYPTGHALTAAICTPAGSYVGVPTHHLHAEANPLRPYRSATAGERTATAGTVEPATTLHTAAATKAHFIYSYIHIGRSRAWVDVSLYDTPANQDDMTNTRHWVEPLQERSEYRMSELNGSVHST